MSPDLIRCARCQHWAREFHGSAWGYCERTRMVRGKAKDPKSKAVAMDGIDVMAALKTHREFGCVQGAPKEVA